MNVANLCDPFTQVQYQWLDFLPAELCLLLNEMSTSWCMVKRSCPHFVSTLKIYVYIVPRYFFKPTQKVWCIMQGGRYPGELLLWKTTFLRCDLFITSRGELMQFRTMANQEIMIINLLRCDRRWKRIHFLCSRFSKETINNNYRGPGINLISFNRK